LSALSSPSHPPDLDLQHAGTLALHARSVASLAVRVCRRLGLDDAETRLVEDAALLHDVGKLAIPHTILDKPGPLDDHEWSVVRRHPLLGEAVLAAVAPDPEVQELVRHHHERWDGVGYPDGLAGEQIPLGARIIAACDAYDAMTTARSYCAARSMTAALAEIVREAGRQFDPDVALALVAELSLLHPLPEADPVGCHQVGDRDLAVELPVLAGQDVVPAAAWAA
jgi:two-component system cell cycle response regulator